MHKGDAPRESVYIGLLPDVPLNAAYAKSQLQALLERQLPPDFGGGQRLPDALAERIFPPAAEIAASVTETALASNLLAHSAWE